MINGSKCKTQGDRNVLSDTGMAITSGKLQVDVLQQQMVNNHNKSSDVFKNDNVTSRARQKSEVTVSSV